jgi:hypothetical protein
MRNKWRNMLLYISWARHARARRVSSARTTALKINLNAHAE